MVLFTVIVLTQRKAAPNVKLNVCCLSEQDKNDHDHSKRQNLCKTHAGLYIRFLTTRSCNVYCSFKMFSNYAITFYCIYLLIKVRISFKSILFFNMPVC